MKAPNGRHAIGILILFLGATGVTAVFAAGPQASEPEPTAFADGANNATRLVDALRGTGHPVDAAVATLGLVRDSPHYGQSVLMVLDPARPPTRAEATLLDEHVMRGGSVWLADGAGAWNAWLAGYGVSVRPHRLLDAAGTGIVQLESTGGPASVPVAAQSPSSLLVDDGTGWSPLLVAPSSVHLDLDDNGSIDRIDVPGPHVVAGSYPQPAGGVIVLSADASLFLNRFMEDDDVGNAAWVRWVATDTLPPDIGIVIDESGHGWAASETNVISAIRLGHDSQRIAPAVIWLAAAGAVGTAVLSCLFLARLEPYRPHSFDDATVAPPPAQPSAAGRGRADDEPSARRPHAPPITLRAPTNGGNTE